MHTLQMSYGKNLHKILLDNIQREKGRNHLVNLANINPAID